MANKNWTYYKQAGIVVSLFCLYLLTNSCSGDNKVLATVDDVSLYENDAYILMKHNGLDPDNVEEKKTFVKQWCETEALKAELKQEYPDTWNLVQLRSESFAGDLARIYIEEIELKKQLDTIVEKEEIQAYYDLHKDEFKLNDYIVKALYLKIPVGVDFKDDKIHQHYLLKNDKDLSKINSYAKLYAENFYFNDSIWIYFDELTNDVPLTKYNIDNIVLNRTKTYFSDDNYTYFLNIIDYKVKDEAPPVDFLANEIKNIIVLNRLQELRKKNESKMIQRIKAKHEVTVNI